MHDELSEFERSGAYHYARQNLNNGVRDMYDYLVRKRELSEDCKNADIDVRTILNQKLKAIDDKDAPKFIDDHEVADILLWVMVEAVELLTRYVHD